MNPLINTKDDSREYWNNVYDQYCRSSRRWRRFCFINLLILLVAVIAIIYAAQLPVVIPSLYKEDSKGVVIGLGRLNRNVKFDDDIVSNQLASYIVNLRQIPLSTEIRQIYVAKVKYMSSPALFSNTIAPMMSEQYIAAGHSGSVTVKVKSVTKITQDVWVVDWIENTNGGGDINYKATINFTKLRVTSKNVLRILRNPVGILVKEININQVIR